MLSTIRRGAPSQSLECRTSCWKHRDRDANLNLDLKPPPDGFITVVTRSTPPPPPFASLSGRTYGANYPAHV